MKLENVIATRKHKTVYRDGDKTIKVFDADYSKADILNEALNQARIEETALNIPKVLGVNMVEGKWAIVSEHIEGKTLAQLMEENPDTLLIITSDHETGGIRIPEEGENLFAAMTLNEHTATPVRVFAVGQGAEYFKGKTLDNTDIAKFIINAIEGN